MKLESRFVCCLFASLALGACIDNAGAGATPKQDKQVAEQAVAEQAVAAIPSEDDASECLHGTHKEGGSCDHAGPPKAETGHFGSDFTLADAKPLAGVIGALTSSGKEASDHVQVSGKVDKVCKKMGCWMVIKDGESVARVIMKDHAFAVPMNCDGKAAMVEGVIAQKTLTEGQVKHLAKDAGEDPSKVEGERKEFVLTATAVRLES